MQSSAKLVKKYIDTSQFKLTFFLKRYHNQNISNSFRENRKPKILCMPYDHQEGNYHKSFGFRKRQDVQNRRQLSYRQFQGAADV